MAFAYAIFSLKEAVSLDDVYQHIVAIPELSGAHIEGALSYVELQVGDHHGFLVQVRDVHHTLDYMSVIIYDIRYEEAFLTAHTDIIAALVAEVIVQVPLVGTGADIKNDVMSRQDRPAGATLVYNYPYDAKLFSDRMAKGRRLNIRAVKTEQPHE